MFTLNVCTTLIKVFVHFGSTVTSKNCISLEIKRRVILAYSYYGQLSNKEVCFIERKNEHFEVPLQRPREWTLLFERSSSVQTAMSMNLDAIMSCRNLVSSK